jgi:hypothetical protein
MPRAAKIHREAKPAHEKRIFLEFCDAAHLPLVPDSIRQPDPPDVTADLEGSGTRAFELVRLNHNEELMSTSLLRESSHFWTEQFARLPAPHRERLASMYSDAHVLLQFSRPTQLARASTPLSSCGLYLQRGKPGPKESCSCPRDPE